MVCLEDVLRTMANAAAGETMRVTRRIQRGNSETLPPMPLPASAWELHDGVGRADNLRANFAFDLCAPPVREARRLDRKRARL